MKPHSPQVLEATLPSHHQEVQAIQVHVYTVYTVHCIYDLHSTYSVVQVRTYLTIQAHTLMHCLHVAGLVVRTSKQQVHCP